MTGFEENCVSLFLSDNLKHHIIFFVTDENECLLGPCDENAVCQNTPGSFHCVCKAGFTGDGEFCQGAVVIVQYVLTTFNNSLH